jgi:hypothetical protein
MSPAGGGQKPPPLPPSVDEATFIWLLPAQGKTKEGGAMPNFIKNIE